MDPLDMEKIRKNLEEKYGPNNIRDVDVMSYVMYPKVGVKFRCIFMIYFSTLSY